MDDNFNNRQDKNENSGNGREFGVAAQAIKKEKRKKEKKPWSKKKKIIFFGCLSILFLLIAGTVVYAYYIINDPLSQFKSAAEQAIEASVVPVETEPLVTYSAEPSVEPDPYDVLLSQADFSILEHYRNIMLIGVDHSEERETWKGKRAFHSDVMIVLSINKDTGKIDLISLPRDTYAKIPGVKGVYKLNASIDCGGGWPKESGFKKVCEAAT